MTSQKTTLPKVIRLLLCFWPRRHFSFAHIFRQSPCDLRQHSASSVTWPDQVTSAIPFLVCVTGKTFCLHFTVISCSMHWLKAQFLKVHFWHSVVNRCVHQVTSGHPWDFPCFRSSYWLVLSVSILACKESYIFLGSCPVSVVSSSRTIAQKENFNIHTTGFSASPSLFVKVSSSRILEREKLRMRIRGLNHPEWWSFSFPNFLRV